MGRAEKRAEEIRRAGCAEKAKCREAKMQRWMEVRHGRGPFEEDEEEERGGAQVIIVLHVRQPQQHSYRPPISAATTHLYPLSTDLYLTLACSFRSMWQSSDPLMTQLRASSKEIGIALRVRAINSGVLLAFGLLVLVVWFWGISEYGMGDTSTPLTAALLSVTSVLAYIYLFGAESQVSHLAKVTNGHTLFCTMACGAISLVSVVRFVRHWQSGSLWEAEGLIFVLIPTCSAAADWLFFAALVRGLITPWCAFRGVFLMAFVFGISGTFGIWLMSEASSQTLYPPGRISFGSSVATWLAILSASVVSTPTMRQLVSDAITVLPLTAGALQHMHPPQLLSLGKQFSESSAGSSVRTPPGTVRRLIPSRTRRAQTASSTTASSASSMGFSTSAVAMFPPGRSFLPKERHRFESPQPPPSSLGQGCQVS